MDFSNSALYSASFSVFLLTPFDTWYYYFGSNLSLVLLIKNACNVILQSSKDEYITLPHGFIRVFILDFIGVILIKECWKKWGIEKNDIKRWSYRGMVYRRGVRPFSTLCTHTVRFCFKFNPPANSEFFPT